MPKSNLVVIVVASIYEMLPASISKGTGICSEWYRHFARMVVASVHIVTKNDYISIYPLSKYKRPPSIPTVTLIFAVYNIHLFLLNLRMFNKRPFIEQKKVKTEKEKYEERDI